MNCSSSLNLFQSDPSLAVNYCAQSCLAPDACQGICTDPDVTGLGVRIGFYAQAVINVLFVWLAEDLRDSAGGCWSGAILTVALVSAAINQKYKQNMTLHDAVLVLNFITLSCVASIAVAPMSDIWRQSSHSQAQLAQSSSPDPATDIPAASNTADSLPASSTPDSDANRLSVADGMYNGSEGSSRPPSTVPLIIRDTDDPHEPSLEGPDAAPPHIISETVDESSGPDTTLRHPLRRHRTVTGRGILSISLLVQVVLQWVWAIYIFVSPRYSQPWCSGRTTLFIFLHRVEVSKIHAWTNTSALPSPQTDDPVSIFIWPAWLGFCLFWPSMYIILLVLRSSEIEDKDYQRMSASRRNTSSSDREMPQPVQSSGEPSASLTISKHRQQSGFAEAVRLTIPRTTRRGASRIIRRSRKVLQFIWGFVAPPFLLQGSKKNNFFTVDSGIWFANLIAMLVVIIFVVSSELQLHFNCLIRTGSTWGFGQIAAVLFALAPCWALVDIIHHRMYPGTVGQQGQDQPRNHGGDARRQRTTRPPNTHARTPSETPLLGRPSEDEGSASDSASPGIPLRTFPPPSIQA